MYALFEACTCTPEDGRPRRGARIVCGRCHKVAEIIANTMRNSSGFDDDIQEKNVTHKFIKLGWKVGTNIHQHRCPACFSSSKYTAIRRNKAITMKDNKIVDITPLKPTTFQTSTALQSTMADKTAPRAMTRDERYLIYKKIDEHYVGEKIGYQAGWSDAKVAKDLGVPQAFVAIIRDETFGPDVDEATTEVMKEAREILAEIRSIDEKLKPILTKTVELLDRSYGIEAKLAEIGRKR